jgi:cob(I)alamin adenosyltransferase
MSDEKIDIGQLAAGNEATVPQPIETNDHDDALTLSPVPSPSYTVVHHQDIAWIEATQGLQSNLLRSLRDYKARRKERNLLATQREHMVTEVTEHYIKYLREEARLSSEAALSARDSILKQELAKLRQKLFTELADLIGVTVREIEQIAQSHLKDIETPAIKQAYAKFVMDKILVLLEQSDR